MMFRIRFFMDNKDTQWLVNRHVLSRMQSGVGLEASSYPIMYVITLKWRTIVHRKTY
jgi:hypothetical protein